ncbi:MAG: DMT family transporter, partial [Kiloniellales bacterium]
MVELWIPITLGAAFFQTLRSALQKRLRARLSTAGATYVRFLYASPLILLYFWGLTGVSGLPVPEPNPIFFLYCLLGGVAQILFTFFLIWMFSFRNFAVGTTFSKTEVVLVALLGFLILGDRLTLAAAAAIGLSLIGVVALSVAHSEVSLRGLFLGLGEKPTLIGLTSGLFLGASVVFFRAATLSLGGEGFLMQAASALAVSVLLQTALMSVYLRLREPGQITAVLRNWPAAVWVGVAGAAASICWFTAFALQNAAYVRALGQVELVFTFLASGLFFKERSNAVELVGIALIVAAILIL